MDRGLARRRHAKPAYNTKTMELKEIKERLRRTDGLSNTLGMDFISTPEPDGGDAGLVHGDGTRHDHLPRCAWLPVQVACGARIVQIGA